MELTIWVRCARSHILNPISASQACLKRTLNYRRTNIEKNVASRKLNTTSQKNSRGISALNTWNGRWTSPLTIQHHRQHGYVYSYHGYWEFGEGPKRYRRRGKMKRQNMQHLTQKTTAFSIGIFFFFNSNKYDWGSIEGDPVVLKHTRAGFSTDRNGLGCPAKVPWRFH